MARGGLGTRCPLVPGGRPGLVSREDGGFMLGLQSENDRAAAMRRSVFWRPVRWVSAAVAALLILVVRLYQWLISPLLGRHCRFEPTCSVYFVEAVRKYGPVFGLWRGVRRILRCHPWNPGGYDPP